MLGVIDIFGLLSKQMQRERERGFGLQQAEKSNSDIETIGIVKCPDRKM